jgi:hypothetical protein
LPHVAFWTPLLNVKKLPLYPHRVKICH